MIELLKAIQTGFNANTSLTSVFARGAENADSANAAALPSCLIVEMPGTPDYTTSITTFHETDHIQFTVRANTPSVVRLALDQIQKTFDHKPLTIVNDALIDARVSRIWPCMKEDEGVFRGDLEFAFIVGRLF